MNSTNNIYHSPLGVGGIDSHQHFWKYDPIRNNWIKEEMSVIQKDFLPADLEPVLKENGIDGCVVVQSDSSENENDFQLMNAGQNDFIKGIVGWVDLQSDDIEERLVYYHQFKKMKGFRHVLQGEANRAFMLQPAFMHGVSKLQQFGFTYDILIFPDQLKYAREFIAAFPQQKFVIDHIAKPNIKDGLVNEWEKDIRAVAQFENVYCKISGMVTEANWKNWQQQNFVPYLDVITEAFGSHRIMFGSDWPVCLVAASYKTMKGITDNYFSSFTKEEQLDFYSRNAIKFYNL